MTGHVVRNGVPCLLVALLGWQTTVKGDEALGPIRAHNAIWLAPDGGSFPALSYAFRLGDEIQRFSFDKMPALYFRRGVSLSLGLDVFVARPSDYRTRLRYQGKLDGRDVVVVEVSGPAFKLIRGNGIHGKWRGYTSGGASAAEIVVDERTWQPLVSRYGDMEVHFLNYVDVLDVQQAPLRIVVFDRRGTRWDFRFKVLDDRVWLFDRSFRKGEVVASTEEVTLDGMPPANVRRAERFAPLPELKRFDPKRITDRESLCPEDELAASIVKRNRAWLNPKLSHLKSVEFVHHMEPQLLDERFVWRRDGASLVEVIARGDRRGTAEIGKRWVTTPEPAYYCLAPNARFAKREDADTAFFPNHVRNHLMGTRTNFVTLDWGRAPDRFIIESAALADDGSVYSIVLRPKERRYHVNAGAMFHSCSWAYVHHKRVASSKIVVDAGKLLPLRETDYSSDGGKVCDAEFSDYREVGPDQFVPQRIHLHFPAHGFDADYEFEWRKEGLWILKSGVSQFAKAGNPQCEEIRGLEFDRAAPDPDAALEVIKKTRDYLDSKPASEKRAIAALPFRLGTKTRCGAHEVLFTLNDQMDLVAKVTTAGEPPGKPVAIMLLDDVGRLLGAGQGRPDPRQGAAADTTLVALGRSPALKKVQHFSISPGGPPASDVKAMAAATYPFVLDRSTPVDVGDQTEGKTRVKRARFEARPDGSLVCDLELVSQDYGKEFEADAVAALLDEQSRLITAARTTTSLRVVREIVTARVTLSFGPIEGSKKAYHAVLGVSRGRVTAGPMGSLWARYTFRRDEPPFTAEQLLAGDDPGTWKVGLGVLQKKARAFELFDDEHFDQRRMDRGRKSRLGKLRPHCPRLAAILGETADPGLLADTCRLLGHAGDPELIDALAVHLTDERDLVKDGAAVGLGLLGDDRGLERLVAILERPIPPRPRERSRRGPWDKLDRWHSDAAAALRGIGSDEAITLIGNHVIAAMDRAAAAPKRDSDAYRASRHVAYKLAALLGHTRHPVALDFLLRASRRPDRDMGGDLDLLDPVPYFGGAARDFFLEAIRARDANALRQLRKTSDPFYLPFVRAMLFGEGLDERTFSDGVRYLRGLKSPEALAALRELYDSDVHGDLTLGRLGICRALASQKDYRGLECAFEVLTDVSQRRQLPEDPEQRKQAERRSRSLRRAAASVFDWKVPKGKVSEFLSPRATSTDPATQLAVLRVLEETRYIAPSIRPAIEKMTASTDGDVAELAVKVLRRAR